MLCSYPATLLAQSDSVSKTGTGFVIDRAGTIITNWHVIDGCGAVSALASDGNRSVQVIASDRANDLALLRSAEPLPVSIALRSGDQRLRVGEAVITLGYPLQGVVASSLTVTTGSLSALAGLNDDTRMFQLTAPVQPGNSGGPVVDTSGHLVGIVASKLSPLWVAAHTGDLPENVNFAIRSQVVQAFLDANGINYELSRSDSPKGASDIADMLRQAILPIRCGSGQTRSTTTAQANYAPLWKSLMSGDRYSLRFDGEFLYVEVQLTEEQRSKRTSAMWELRKRSDGHYSGKIHQVGSCSYSNRWTKQNQYNRCSFEREVEVTVITSSRIEGTSMVPPREAKFDCEKCEFDKPPAAYHFVWIPE